MIFGKLKQESCFLQIKGNLFYRGAKIKHLLFELAAAAVLEVGLMTGIRKKLELDNVSDRL